MVNKILILVTLFTLQTTYSQEIGSHIERYIFLSRMEYEVLIENKHESSLNGNYYIVDKKQNISIKKYKKGIKEGEWLNFYSLFNDIKLTSTTNYVKGKLHGYFFRTDNHTYYEEGYYKNGKKYRLWTKKYFDKDILETENYNKSGKKHGDYTKIDFEFEEKEIISYKNGRKHGKYYLENKKYKTTIKGTYRNNLKHGIWTTKDEYLTKINEDGTETPSIKKECYKNGKILKIK